MASKSTARGAVSGAAIDQIFGRVTALAHDLRWSWSRETQRLFAALDPRLWEATNHDPLLTMARMLPVRRAAVAADERFLAHLAACERERAAYYKARPWFERSTRGSERRMRVAYFCSEYAIHESMQQYSGGLGVLAGDHLKSASDLGVPLIAVGLLYRGGYYQQEFRRDGTHAVLYPRYDFEQMPLHDLHTLIRVPLGRHPVAVKLWKLQVGRTPLILLDTDLPENKPADRKLTENLYHGPPEHRMLQQILLGIGGYQALLELDLRPTVCHLNEGHAAFVGLERLREQVEAGRSWRKAVELVRHTSVFTTHTPVAAGHDRYDPKLIRKYFDVLAGDLGLSSDDLLALGRENPHDRKEPFCMTVLALNLSEHCNGVAKLHGDTSRRMWQKLYEAPTPAAVPIGHVTNGVHTATWLADEALPLYRKYLKPNWVNPNPADDPWARAKGIPAGELWRLRNLLRARLVEFVRARLRQQIQRGLGSAEELQAACETFDEDTLTLGFARRFATYKRAALIFSNARRLAGLLGDAKRPVQIVFAGKAHPADQGGQDFARQVYAHAHGAGFRGRVVVLDNYDMHVGHMLTSGADVWLNTPLRPMEASGTSGMKPPLHGGLNCSILDGWWPEAYNRRNGWAIGDVTPRKSAEAQNRFDAESFYDLLEREIVPRFYQRDKQGIPQAWVKMMVESLRTVGPAFNTHRMVGEYVDHYYRRAHGPVGRA